MNNQIINTNVKKLFTHHLLPQWISIGVCGLVSFSLSLYIAAKLNPSLFGSYSILLSIGSIFALFFDSGYKTLVYRQGAHLPHIISTIYSNFFLQNIILIILVTFFVSIIGIGEFDYIDLISVMFCFISLSFLQICSSDMKGRGLLKEESLLQIRVKLSSSILVLVVVLLTDSITAIFLTWGTATLLITIVTAYVPTLANKKIKISKPNFKLLYFALPFFLFDAAIGLYSKVELLILNQLAVPLYEIGSYAVGLRFIDFQHILFTTVGVIYFNALKGNIRLPTWIMKGGWRFVIYCLVLSTVLFFLSKTIIPVFIDKLFVSKFKTSVVLYEITVFLLIFSLPNILMFQRLLFLRLEKKIIFVVGIALVIAITSGYILIEIFGIMGAALSRTITEATVTLGFALTLYKHERFIKSFSA